MTPTEMSTLIPSVLPDECPYSLAAAYTSRWHSGSRKAARVVLGSTTRLARDLTSKLDQVASLLPEALGLTGRDLALHHSSLPLHLPFVPTAGREHLITQCCRESSIHLRLGIAPAKAGCAKALRFCERCRQSDLRRHGRAYWHRLHQLPGVVVCPEHKLLLTVSTIRPDEIGAGFVEAGDAQADSLIQLSDSALHDAVWLAATIDALLREQALAPGPEKLRALYVQEATDRGYSTANGSVAITSLCADFRSRFGSELLAILGCAESAWLKGMFRTPRGHQQPIRHLLVCRFFDLEARVMLERASVMQLSSNHPGEHIHRIRSPERLARLRPTKRLSWLRAKRAFGAKAREQAQEVYSWLHRNDHEWLLSTRGARRPRSPNLSRWATRDAALVKAIEEAKAATLQEGGPRASRSYLARRVGHWSWLATDHTHLPLATTAIKNAAESQVQFALRRIDHFLREHGTADAAWRVRVACGISTSLSKAPTVADALRNACRCMSQEALV